MSVWGASLELRGAKFADREYLIDSWETAQGLPENSATAMVQTPDGYLWFGTFEGLVRFDGVKFTVFDPSNTPELPSSGIVNLHLDASRQLWVSTYRGLVVSEPNRWTRFRAVPEWRGDYVRTFSEDAGVLCATSFNGNVLRVKGSQMEMLPDPPGKAGSGYLGYVDRSGRIWVSQYQAAFFGYWDGAQWQRSDLADEVHPDCISMRGLSDGRLLVVKSRELLYLEGERIQRRVAFQWPEPISAAWSVNQDQRSNVWISAKGLYRVAPSGEARYFCSTNGLTHDALRFTFEDQERNLWVGTSGGGLMRFKLRTFVAYGEESGLAQRNVKAVLEEAPGRILVGTFGLGLFRWENGRVSMLESNRQPATQYVQCLLRDRDQNLWVGGYSAEGSTVSLTIFSRSGRRDVSNTESGVRSVRALFEDSEGRIWIGGGETVCLFAGGQFSIQKPTNGVRLVDVRCFAEGPWPGSIWAAGREGLFRFADGRWNEVKRPGGDSLEEANCLRFAADGSLWIGGWAEGLLRFKQGEWSSITEDHGLPVRLIASLLEDDLGYWWLGSNRGVVRAPAADLARVADGLLSRLPCQVFNVSDGLASVECTMGMQSAAVKDSQGSLWFATLDGVAMVNPRNLQVNTNPPPVVIESVRFEDFTGRKWFVPIPENGPVTVQPGIREVAVYLAGLQFSAPEKMRFAYQIEGMDDDWRDMGVSRVEYFYPPAPGSYRFRVKASNSDGVWNEAGTGFAFTVQPFWWQTLWFRALAVLGFGSSIAFSVARMQRNKLRRTEERLEQQRALAGERARAAALTQHASDAITLLSADGRVVYESPSTSRILGYAPGHFLGKDPFEFIHPDDQPKVREALGSVVQRTNPGIPFEFRFRHAQGQWIPLEALGVNLLDQPGVHGVLVTTRDITQRKRAELALQASEVRYRAFVAQSTEGIWRYEGRQAVPISLPEDEQIALMLEHGYLAECNDAMARMYGFQRAEELVGAPLRTLVALDPRNLEYLRTFIRSGYRIENVESFGKDREGQVRHFMNSFVGVVEDGQLVRAWGLQRDITARKQAEDALRESEATIRSVFRAAPVGICIMQNRVYKSANEYWCEKFGYPEASILGKTTRLLYESDEEYERVGRELYGHLQEEGLAAIETRLRSSDGVFRDVILTAAPIQADDPVAGTVVIVFDITERKQAEEALRTSEAQLSSALRMTHAGHWEYDVASDTFTFNDNFYRVFRTTAEEAGGYKMSSAKYARRFCHPNDMHMVREETEAAIKTDDPNYSRQLEHRILFPNGEVGYIAVRFFIVKDSKGRTVKTYGVNQDITGRKQLEAQLRQAQKLEAVGQLAGGVAHDFNNILAALMMHLGLLQMNSSLDEETRLSLNEMEVGARRAATLTRQLLMFGRRSVLEIKPLDLSELVENFLKMLHRLIGEQIDLRFDAKTGLPSVEADAGMLEQVVMNLVVNARDAMPKGGRVTISTSLAELTDADVATSPDRRPGRFVCLAVSDTGTGMDEAMLKRIFEPFFTTKEPGKGTGLGLATVHGIVAQHKGWVEVVSEVGKGTTFTIFLPALAQTVMQAAQVAPSEPLRHGRETILLVEDDAKVRQTIGQALRRLGYRVFEAPNGQAAMQLWQTHGAQVDLLLTDMVMPEGMTGLELTERLQALRPGLKAIIASGYSAEIVQAGVPVRKGIVYLPKPYAAKVLAEVVRNCLDS